MKEKGQIAAYIKRKFAEAEIQCQTQNVEKLRNETRDGWFRYMVNKDDLINGLIKNYQGHETPQTLGISLLFEPGNPFVKEMEDFHHVKLLPTDSINSMIEKIYYSK